MRRRIRFRFQRSKQGRNPVPILSGPPIPRHQEGGMTKYNVELRRNHTRITNQRAWLEVEAPDRSSAEKLALAREGDAEWEDAKRSWDEHKTGDPEVFEIKEGDPY
jgi:hypothetical protein